MGVWEASDSPGKTTETSARPGEDTARTRSRTDKARESREKVGAGYQEERKEWTDGGMQDPGERSGADKEVGVAKTMGERVGMDQETDR